MRLWHTIMYYGDWQSPFGAMLSRVLEEEQPSPQEQVSLSPEQEQSVYRFKAALKYRTGLWRRIDIQGG